MVFAIYWHESATDVHVSPRVHLPTVYTGFECPVSCIKLELFIYFTYGNIHVSILFSQIIPPLSSPAGSRHTRSHPWQSHEEKTWQARRIRFSGVSKRPAHKIPPMTRSWGENLTGKVDHIFRDSEKLPPALTLKMISVFLMLASIDYSLISVTQAEGLPRSLPK